MAFRPVFGGFIEWSVNAMASQYGQLSQNDLKQLSSNEVNELIDSLLVELADRKEPLPRHGRISNPQSRAQFLYEEGKLDFGQVNECEGGKGFPGLLGNLPDPDAPDDVYNRPPPADGLIASGGHTADARALLNATGSHWKKHNVRPGPFNVIWEYRQVHKTRRWSYWITKVGWNPDEPLARKHFEDEPVEVFLNTFRPYYAPGSDVLYPRPIHQHTMTLPDRKGYHVLLAVWDVANTAAAFYQVIDLDFIS
ncbi:lytic polysaccharide monooxygenase auxiliary activity family 9 protein [Pseudomonas brassicacearum]|uniref:lytic polysaccharide monooxygenase auxiliary activity family 9 protein n=1 Tax=Pseudomonas brassicacearum TaxID=930166 RepID=UPI001C83A318|nr:lytic polysaccharide monooxygenase auxiliary activity family 9 protein [Pseudomonas brassicacearum]